MPDLTGSLVAHHAGTDRGPGSAYPVKKFAVGRLRDTPEYLVTDTCRMFTDWFEFNAVLFLCIILLKFRPDPET